MDADDAGTEREDVVPVNAERVAEDRDAAVVLEAWVAAVYGGNGPEGELGLFRAGFRRR